MKHPALPQTLTPENLAVWIKENALEVIQHEEKIALTEEVVRELEHKSSLASRKIDELKETEKLFKNILNNGTDVDPDQFDEQGKPKHIPQDVTIPPTKGLKLLQENREWADKQLRDGFKLEVTPVYLIPFPEESMVIGFDIEGTEVEQYSREMTAEEADNNKPLLREAAKKQKKSKVSVEEDPMI